MDARLREGIRLFNEGRYFQCHEILEEFYRDTEDSHKAFLEGLIELAAAFRLFCDFGETQGPVKMARQALMRFENFYPAFLDIRVKDLCEAVDRWVQEIEAPGAQAFPSRLPKIKVRRFSFLP
jgi:predicted metal-dependent hydrolase